MVNGHIAARALAGVLLLAAAVISGPPSVLVAEAQQPAQVSLTGDTVKSFINSYPEVKKQTDLLAKKYKVRVDAGSAANSWGAWMTATAAYGELNGIVKPFGFADFRSWLDVTISVATAYAFAKAGPQMDAGMAQAINQIKNDKSIPDAQKKMMLDQIQASAGAMAVTRPPQSNLDAVAPYLAQLELLFH